MMTLSDLAPNGRFCRSRPNISLLGALEVFQSCACSRDIVSTLVYLHPWSGCIPRLVQPEPWMWFPMQGSHYVGTIDGEFSATLGPMGPKSTYDDSPEPSNIA